jgi:glutaredoxin
MRLTLYGRAECHLCHEMRAVVDRARREVAFELEEVDVEGDPALEAAYGAEVPVLLVNGRKAFKYRVDLPALRARLARDSGTDAASGGR